MQMFIKAIKWRFHDTGQKHHYIYSFYIQQETTTDFLAGNCEFQPYDLECKYAICSGIV